MEYRVRVNIAGAAGVIALGIAASVITSTVVASRAYRSRAREASQREQEVTVRGSARTRVRSDLGIWRVEVQTQGKELQAAFGVLESGTTRVQQFLTDWGFKPGEVALGAIDTATHYARDSAGHETTEISGYRLVRSFSVTSADVDRVATAAGEVTQLLKEGVAVASTRPAFYYSKVADLKVQILGDASRDARARADEIARSSGARVAEVRRAQMGVIQITEPNSTEVSGSGVYDTGTIDKDISVVVTLTLGLSN
jgi:uncharacterized protein